MNMPSSLPGSKRDRTRDQILAAAQHLLMTQSAAGLGISAVTTQAGMVHGTFYNYFDSLPALITELEKLLSAAHAAAAAPLVAGVNDPALRFARITRMALRIVAARPAIGRLMFDAGLPAEGLARGLRARLEADIAEGVKGRVFRSADAALSASLVAGAINGVALDLHRGTLAPGLIDRAVAELLGLLGVTAARARKLAFEKLSFPLPPDMPLGWLALAAKPSLRKGNARPVPEKRIP